MDTIRKNLLTTFLVAVIFLISMFVLLVLGPDMQSIVQKNQKLKAQINAHMVQSTSPISSSRNYWWHLIPKKIQLDATELQQNIQILLQTSGAKTSELHLLKNELDMVVLQVAFSVEPAVFAQIVKALEMRSFPSAITDFSVSLGKAGTYDTEFSVGLFHE